MNEEAIAKIKKIIHLNEAQLKNVDGYFDNQIHRNRYKKKVLRDIQIFNYILKILEGER